LSHAIGYTASLACCHVVCRSAFKALAYKKYQQVPLYLEWAPKDIWDTPAPAAAPATAKPAAAAAADSTAAAGSAAADPAAGDAAAASKPAAAAAAAAAGDEGDEEDGTAAPVACIYVKNLNFATGDAALRKHFDKAVSAAGGSIHSAKVGAVHFTAQCRVTGMTSLAAQHVTKRGLAN
jgi:multiple RNA-binding domain-containing protein 1